jgi:hypothetical protein
VHPVLDVGPALLIIAAAALFSVEMMAFIVTEAHQPATCPVRARLGTVSDT